MNVKYAIFCLAVAIAIIIGNELAKHAPASSQRTSAALNLRIDLSPDSPRDNAVSQNPTNSEYSYIRFRLTNQGNDPVYCPVLPGTNVLLGHVVHRPTVHSEWAALSPSGATAVSDQEHTDRGVAWIELPPGGWIDGQFYDTGYSNEDHAFAFEVKQGPDAAVVHFVSLPFHRHSE